MPQYVNRGWFWSSFTLLTNSDVASLNLNFFHDINKSLKDNSVGNHSIRLTIYQKISSIACFSCGRSSPDFIQTSMSYENSQVCVCTSPACDRIVVASIKRICRKIQKYVSHALDDLSVFELLMFRSEATCEERIIGRCVGRRAPLETPNYCFLD